MRPSRGATAPPAWPSSAGSLGPRPRHSLEPPSRPGPDRRLRCGREAQLAPPTLLRRPRRPQHSVLSLPAELCALLPRCYAPRGGGDARVRARPPPQRMRRAGRRGYVARGPRQLTLTPTLHRSPSPNPNQVRRPWRSTPSCGPSRRCAAAASRWTTTTAACRLTRSWRRGDSKGGARLVAHLVE